MIATNGAMNTVLVVGVYLMHKLADEAEDQTMAMVRRGEAPNTLLMVCGCALANVSVTLTTP